MTHRRWIQDRETGILVEIGDDYSPAILTGPFIMNDLAPYQSMVTGETVSSRSRHRAILREHNLIEVGNETKHLKSKRPTPPPGLKDAIINAIKRQRGY